MKRRIFIMIPSLLFYHTIIHAQSDQNVHQTRTVITNTEASPQPVVNTTTVTTTTIPVDVSTPEDDNIVTLVYTKFAKVSALIGTSLTVKSVNGIVTVSGMVTAQSQADAAAEAAKSVPGVKDVRSNIKVTTNPDLNKPAENKVNY